MSYNTIVHMAGDGDLQQRFIACAAQEGIEQPESWVLGNRWQLCTDTEAISSYEYAVGTGLASIGKRDDVINDGKILAIVQTLRAEQQPA